MESMAFPALPVGAYFKKREKSARIYRKASETHASVFKCFVGSIPTFRQDQMLREVRVRIAPARMVYPCELPTWQTARLFDFARAAR